MRSLLRWLLRIGVWCAALIFTMFLFGPYEPVETRTSFDRAVLSDGVDAYLDQQEAAVPNLRPHSRKQVVWRGLEEVPTPLSILYIHGFSSSLQEIRPVPDLLAREIGANLVYTRLTGHGRDGPAMAEASVEDWMADVAEALAIAREVGRETIVISTSTGGTLAAIAARDSILRQNVKGMIFVAPNFGLKDPNASFLTWPAARYWVPLIAGRTRSFVPRTDAQALYWTTRYPVVALLPMAALAKHAAQLDFSGVAIPALFFYSEDDRVVDARQTDRVVDGWGGPKTVARPDLGEGVDPDAHVVTGDQMSPANTESTVAMFKEWIEGL